MEEIADAFEAAKKGLADCGTETIDGVEFTITYDPDLQPVTGVDDQIFLEMQGATAASEEELVDDALATDVAMSIAMLRTGNNTALLMLADYTMKGATHAEMDIAAHAQTAADRLRAVISGQEFTGPGLYEFEYMGAYRDHRDPRRGDPSRRGRVRGVPADGRRCPVTYLVAEIDNTNGTDDINMYEVDIVTEEGEQAHYVRRRGCHRRLGRSRRHQHRRGCRSIQPWRRPVQRPTGQPATRSQRHPGPDPRRPARLCQPRLRLSGRRRRSGRGDEGLVGSLSRVPPAIQRIARLVLAPAPLTTSAASAAPFPERGRHRRLR